MGKNRTPKNCPQILTINNYKHFNKGYCLDFCQEGECLMRNKIKNKRKEGRNI
jgi:hypothetical protein